jgi:hypothetical protein
LFSDPQSITVSGAAKSLARTGTTENGGKFATSDRAYQMSVNHSYGKRTRHQIRLQFDSLTANPLVSGQNVSNSVSTYLVVDTPNGYDVATAKALVDGFLAFLAASSGAAVSKVLGGES